MARNSRRRVGIDVTAADPNAALPHAVYASVPAKRKVAKSTGDALFESEVRRTVTTFAALHRKDVAVTPAEHAVAFA